MPTANDSTQIDAIRRFNRFYTRRVGLLRERLAKSSFNLTEARVLYELAHHEYTTASRLRDELGLDAGYLSRILVAFEKRALVRRQPSPSDGRFYQLSLTKSGHDAFAELNAASSGEVETLLATLRESERDRLVRAMETIEAVLEGTAADAVPFVVRAHRSGDMGWIVQRHGELYRQEYDWDETFEALVAEIVADFIRRFEPSRERCWIAEKDGERVGSVFVVSHPDHQNVAKLRLLLVEPGARGLGIGGRLVRECTLFARAAGYRTLTLWTNSVLTSARRLYEQEGYRLIQEEMHHSFGHDLVGQTWELDLTSTRAEDAT